MGSAPIPFCHPEPRAKGLSCFTVFCMIVASLGVTAGVHYEPHPVTLSRRRRVPFEMLR